MTYKVHTDPTCNSLETFNSLEEALAAKGLDPKQVLANAKKRSSFSVRNRDGGKAANNEFKNFKLQRAVETGDTELYKRQWLKQRFLMGVIDD